MDAPSDRSWPSGIRIATAVLLVLLAVPDPAEATRVRSLNLEEITHRAERIVMGRCVDVAVETDAGLGQIVTRVTLVVTGTVKGPDARRITFKLLGDLSGRSAPGSEGDALPRFQRGEEVVVFLYGESRSGLTSPVGLGQGKFTLVTDKRGRRLAFNDVANDGLFRNLSPRAEQRLRARHPESAASREIPVDDLLDMVRDLAEE